MTGIRQGLHRRWGAIALMLALGTLVGVASFHVTGADTRAVPAAIAPVPGATREARTQLPDGRWLILDATGVELRLVNAAHDAARPVRTWSLPASRRGASVTLLPSRRVLIWGGFDGTGKLHATGLWFDPANFELKPAAIRGINPRAGHTASILADGRVLFAGGRSADTSTRAQLWDIARGSVVGVDWPSSRIGHRAALQADGSVRMLGGTDDAGRRYQGDAQFVPRLQQFLPATPHADQAATPRLAASWPQAKARGIAPTARLVVQFDQPMRAPELNASSVTLFGPGGRTPVDVVPVEEGRLVFVVPRQPLLPGAPYTLMVDGIFSAQAKPLPLVAIDFETAFLSSEGVPTANPPAPTASALRLQTGRESTAEACAGAARQGPCRTSDRLEDGVWTPGRNNTDSRWRIYTPGDDYAKNRSMARVAARYGVTVVRGRVVRVDQQPVAGAEVSIGNHVARTNADGWFLLFDVPQGRQELYVDGSTANRPGVEYGQFVVGVDVAKGRLTELPFLMHLPRITARDKVRVASPLPQDVVLTHPDMPGLEVTIPAGTIIRDRKGRLVTELALVPTPVNRAPFPVAENYPMYFTVEPGGAVIQGLTRDAARGVRVAYPNYDGHSPGTTAHFWIYDPKEGWRVYGKGRVGKDGKRFEPEAGVALHQTMGGSYSIQNNDPPPEPDRPNCNEGCGSAGTGAGPVAGDPIDLRTGRFFYSETDIAIGDLIPIGLSRTYRQSDTRSRAFGIGTASNYDYVLHAPSGANYSEVWLVLPNGSYVRFDRESGSGSTGSWRQSGSVSGFDGAVIRSANDPEWGIGYRLTSRDGGRLFFGSPFYNTGKSPLRGIEDRHGNRVDLVFEAGLLKKVTSPGGRYFTLTHDTSNRIATASDMTGRTWRYEYQNGLLRRVIFPDQTTQTYTYEVVEHPGAIDNDDRVLTHTVKSVYNRRGFTELTNHYPSNSSTPGVNRVERQTLADGSELSIDYAHYDGTDNGVLVTLPDGSKRRITWGEGVRYPKSDTVGYGTSIAQTTLFGRAPGSERITSRTDALGRRTEYQFDAAGLTTQVTYLAGTADARTVRMTYTGDGDLASVVDPLGRTTTLEYVDRCLSRMRDHAGRITEITCNGNGQPVSVTDPLGNTTTFHYDGAELTAVVDPLGRVTGFAYDVLGRLIVVRDPKGRISRREYDINGRVSKLIDPSGNVTEIGYDAKGNVSAVLLPHGNGVTYSYDNRDRLTERRDALGQAERWTYDALGRALTYTDRKGQVTRYTYDALGRPKTTTFADGSVQTATYDAGDRLLALADTSAGNIAWSYDLFDQLLQETSAQGSVAYQYDLLGRRVSMTAGRQPTVEYRYDVAGQLKRILQGSEVVEFDYDALGRRTALKLPNGVQAAYQYDAASQLTGLAYAKPDASVLGDIGYAYNEVGQRIAQSGSFASVLLPAAANDNAFDDNNRQTRYQGNPLSYDANGNMTGDGQRTYVWNARDQLVAIQQAGQTIAAFEYDAMGRRKLRQEGGAAIAYLHDGTDPVQETAGGTTVGMLTGLAIDERFARGSGSERKYFVVDGLGSTKLLADYQGVAQELYKYTPYGETQSSVGSENPYRYTGREQDASGLYYYRARYYHPGLARFISEDPIGFRGGDWNVYAYVGGDPISFIDPDGLQFLPYSRNLNTRAPYRIPDGAAQRLNVVWGGVTAGAAAGVYAPAAVGAGVMAPEAAAGAWAVCRAPVTQRIACAVLGCNGYDPSTRQWSAVDDLPAHYRQLREISEGLGRESQRRLGSSAQPRP